MSKHVVFRGVLYRVTRPTFLALDLTGILSLCLLFLIQDLRWMPIIATMGSTLLTLGITLPIAIYSQAEANRRSFHLLRACEKAGIKALFVSRHSDSEPLRRAIDTAVNTSSTACLLGISFTSFFDPNSPHTPAVTNMITGIGTSLRVLMLDPTSAAAERRQLIEEGVSMKLDIQRTLDNGLVAAATHRISTRLQNDECFAQAMHDVEKLPRLDWQSELRGIAEALGIEVRLYDHDPIMMLLGFQSSLFAEQYHFGRPTELGWGVCLGKRVPTIEYKRASEGYRFFKSHFEYVWNHASRDATCEIVDKAIQRRKLTTGRAPVCGHVIA